ncbi:MAG: hypothetical protein ACR5K9_00130 [Wolbachia sp.]
MGNDNEQEHNNELKVISKIEIDTELRGFDNKSINQLSNALAEEKSRLDELVIKVDANYEGLTKDLNDLKQQVNDLIPEEAPPHINIAGEHELL